MHLRRDSNSSRKIIIKKTLHQHSENIRAGLRARLMRAIGIKSSLEVELNKKLRMYFLQAFRMFTKDLKAKIVWKTDLLNVIISITKPNKIL
jgi:hypothetical protein